MTTRLRVTVVFAAAIAVGACASGSAVVTPAPPAAAETATATAEPPAGGGVEVRESLFATGIPEIPAEVFARLKQYQNTRAAGFGDWVGATGEMLITTRFAETSQVHRVAAPMGARSQVTFEAEPIRGVTWAPWQGREGFFFLKDHGGAEAYQVFFFDMARGQPRLVTDGTSRHVGLTASPSGRWLVWSSTARNNKDYDVYLLDLHSDAPARRVAETTGYRAVMDFSPDDSEMLLLHYVSSVQAEVHRLAMDGTLTLLADGGDLAAGAPIYNGSARYSHDGASVWFVSNRWGEFRQLGQMQLDKGLASAVAKTADVPWDVTGLSMSDDGRWMAYVVNRDGLSELNLRKMPGFQPVAVGGLGVGKYSGLRFDAKGERLAVAVNGPAGPNDVHVLDLTKSPAAPTRWTRSEVGGLDTSSFVAPTLVRYPTFDKDPSGAQRQIPAFVYQPPGDGPFPVIILIHGGPESQYRPRFSSAIQRYVLEQGIAVVAPNVRGSAGYGKSWLMLDNGMLREDSVKDIGALLDWLPSQPALDASRVGVLGGSYGGYMVLAAMARYSDRLACGAESVGISNFVTFLRNTKAYRRDLRRAEYGDERSPEMLAHLEAISPTRKAHLIAKPLFVAQGANDPRVPASESEQIVEIVTRQGTPVWYLLAKDEGHGFRKKKNRDYFGAALTVFWDRFLVARSPPGAR